VIGTLRARPSQSSAAGAEIPARLRPRPARQLIFFIAGVSDLQLGGLEPQGDTPVVAPGDLSLHQQRTRAAEADFVVAGGSGSFFDGAQLPSRRRPRG